MFRAEWRIRVELVNMNEGSEWTLLNKEGRQELLDEVWREVSNGDVDMHPDFEVRMLTFIEEEDKALSMKTKTPKT